jgi:hypothetical protein
VLQCQRRARIPLYEVGKVLRGGVGRYRLRYTRCGTVWYGVVTWGNRLVSL